MFRAPMRPVNVTATGVIVRYYRVVAAALAALLMAGAAGAQERKQVIGNWMVTVEQDRFGDGSRAIAMTVQSGNILALRCLQKKMSLALLGKYKPGDIYVIKFRVDRADVVDTVGMAISDEVLQIETTPQMVRQMSTGKEYALRVAGDHGSQDFVFRAGTAQKALVPVIAACPAAKED